MNDQIKVTVEALGGINNIILTIGLIITSLGSLYAAIKQRFNTIKLNSIDNKIDITQNDRLKEHAELIQNHTEILKHHSAQLDKIIPFIENQEKLNLKELKKNQIKDFEVNLKDRLDIVVSSLATNPSMNLDDDYLLLLDEGVKQASLFFKEIYRKGFDNIDVKTASLRANSVLRVLWQQHGAQLDIPKELLIEIKESIIYPAVNGLYTDLKTFSSKGYNGSSPDKFMELAYEFSSDFIKEVSKEYSMYKNKYNKIKK